LQNEVVNVAGKLFTVDVTGNKNFCSHVLSLPGRKVSYMELSLSGTFAPLSENEVELSLLT